MDAIFIPFFSTKPKGTGLGLAVSRDIIEKHRGTLTVENTSASGTEFLIILPEDHVS
jgi:signal transduction histidine kinase